MLGRSPKNMRSLIIFVTYIFSALFLHATGAKENTPSSNRELIISSQFVFVGKMKIIEMRFIDEDRNLIADPKGIIKKAYLEDRFKNHEMIPAQVQKWSLITPSIMLKGNLKHAKPFLKETWIDSSLSVCGRNMGALSGEDRIWFLVIPEVRGKEVLAEDYPPAKFKSISIEHLEETKKLLKTKMENKSQ